jgi:hypothetical protein
MKSFRQHITEASVLVNLIDKHDDPFSFLAAAMDAIANGTLKLKTRGLANARELIAAWNRSKKRKIKLKEAVDYITEKKQTYVKGWTLKNKIHTSTTDFSNWHIKQVANNLRKFGLNKRSLLKIINDAWPDAPETFPNEHIEELENGLADNNVYIEEALQKKGYCMFVLDPTHGSISGWDEKSARLGAKVLDDKYLPFEKDGFKLFEVKTIKGKSKYIKSKYDWYTWLDGKQAAGKRTEIGSTMAQFREEYITELFEKPYKWKKSGKIDKSKLDPAPTLIFYWFKTDDGREIEVHIHHTISEGEHWARVEFIDETHGTMDITNEGDAFRIMSTVLDIIKDAIKTTQPDVIHFSADKNQSIPGNAFKLKATGRAKLYKTMVKRFAGKVGYKSKDRDAGHAVDFTLTKK